MTNVVLRQLDSKSIAAKKNPMFRSKNLLTKCYFVEASILFRVKLFLYSVHITDLENDIYQLDKEMFQLD